MARSNRKENDMREVVKTNTRGPDLKELKKLFGPAPVLSTESLKNYNAILKSLREAIKPDDFVMEILVIDLADATWEIQRCKRLKVLVADYKHLEQQEEKVKEYFNQRRRERAAKQAEAVKAKEEAAPSDDAVEAEQLGQSAAPTSQVDRMLELEVVISETKDEVDDILSDAADELEQFATLKSEITYYERFDRLQAIAMRRREDVLVQMRLYREGLDQRARQASDEIIEAEFQETNEEAPSIAGPGDGEK